MLTVSERGCACKKQFKRLDDLISLETHEQRTFLREHREYLAKRLEELTVHLAYTKPGNR
jgi:hypothetical protein